MIAPIAGPSLPKPHNSKCQSAAGVVFTQSGDSRLWVQKRHTIEYYLTLVQWVSRKLYRSEGAASDSTEGCLHRVSRAK